MGSVRGRPAMQIAANFHATNIIDRDVIAVATILRKPRVHGLIFVRHPRRDIYGRYPILPGRTTVIDVSFWIQPPVAAEGESFSGSIAVVDQFGNRHWVRAIRFDYH